jgi:hypothetical protein
MCRWSESWLIFLHADVYKVEMNMLYSNDQKVGNA